MRLHPGGAPPLLGVDAVALRDARVAIDSVWGDEGLALAQALDEHDDRGARAAGGARRRARRGCRRPTRSCASRSRGSTTPRPTSPRWRTSSASASASCAGASSAAVGYGPKRLSRVLRLGHALDAARAGEQLGRVAADAGYADQAHFAHDCRELAGVAPSALLAALTPSAGRERPFSTRHAAAGRR